jgi:hypothetical protein
MIIDAIANAMTISLAGILVCVFLLVIATTWWLTR